MIAAPRLSEAQYRLARHYLDKLRMVDRAMSRGQANAAYGLSVFDQEWEQIRHWQAWTILRTPEDTARAELCKEFPLAGLEVLANRNTAADHLAWLQAALEAAHQLDDKEVERALYYELMMTYYRLGSLEMIKHCATQLLNLSEAADDPRSMERAYFGLAAYCEERGKYSESESYLQQALELAMQIGDDVETGRMLNALGSVALYVGEFRKGYHYFLRYLELMEARGQKNKICHALLALGESLTNLEAYDEAESYLQRAVTMCRTLGFQRFLGVALLNLGTLAIEQDHLDKARLYLLEGLQAVRTLGIQRQIIPGLTALGYVDLRRGDFTGALGYLREGLELAREGGRPRNICDMQIALANTYLAMNDLDAARVALHEALTIAQSLGSRPQQIQALSIAVAYSQRLDKNDQAAIWAGVIVGESVIDKASFPSVCTQLETALGTEGYQERLAQGKTQSLEAVVCGALTFLA